MNKKKKDKRKIWRIIFVIVLIIAIVDWAIPDPLILIDEILLTLGAIASFRQAAKTI